jgi:hypothetical protein
MSNRTEAAQRKLRQLPPGDYRHCACSRLYMVSWHAAGGGEWYDRYDRHRRVSPKHHDRRIQN